MKVIFLDVDGVLNGSKTKERAPNGCMGVEPRKCALLRRIVRETGAAVVLPSCWRHYPDILPYLYENLGPTVEVIGKTPDFGMFDNACRGDEIKAWLDEHPEVHNYVIIDDRTDMEPVKSALIETDFRYGLNQRQVLLAIKRLNQH